MKASSESGECASLISRGSFSVLDATCLPAMGVPYLLPVPFQTQRRLCLRAILCVHRKVRSCDVGTCAATGRAIFRSQEPNIHASPGQIPARMVRGPSDDSVSSRRPGDSGHASAEEEIAT